jgi:threonyl-tRNA synthetase
LADAHIICAKEQADDEIKNVLDLIDYANNIFGLEKGKDYRYRLSLGDRDDNKKYYKDDAAWDKAEKVLRTTLEKIGAPYFEAKGEAAFYGPKIDVQIKKINGQEETAFTVQYDFVMPKRFELKYIDTDGKENEPIVIHRSSIGCFERTMAFLIEHYAGAFPVWLSPVQAVIIPISDKVLDYAKEVMTEMQKAASGAGNQLRLELDSRNEPLSAKIRSAQLKKVPYMVIVGEKERDARLVSLRLRSGQNAGTLTIAEMAEKIREKETSRSLDL